jgi:tetratricopeptide (TPR) repeat protein
VSISRPRNLLVAVAAVALLLLAGVAYLVGHHASLPAPGSEKYEQYVEAFDVGIAALDADVPQIAGERLNKAIDLVPGEPAAWANRGLLEIRDGRLDEALHDLHEAERLAPENAAIQQLLGLAEQRRGQLAAAAEHFQTAIKLEPKNVMALYRLAVVVDQQQGPDSDAEYQRLTDRILAVQPNNLFILQSKLRVALRRGDRAAARDTVERLKPLSAKWSPQSKKQLADLDQALADPAAKVDLSKALLLMNLMRAEQGFRRDAAAVDADDKLAETALETLVRLPPPRHTPAEPDTDLTFTAQPIPDAPTGRWDALAPVWLDKKGQPAIAIANDRQVRIIGRWHAREAVPQRGITLPSINVAPNGLLPLDWNNDFRTDLLLAGPGGLRFYEQQADGSFTDVTAKTGLSAEVLHGDYFAAWAADVDLDGDLDIILARRTGSPLLLQNNFDGTFQSRPIFDEVEGARAFVWADIDNDGAPDAALLDVHGRLHIYANERSGHFEPWPAKPPDDTFVALAVGDVNHDGLLNIVPLRQDGSIVRIADRDKRSAWDVSELAKWDKFPPEMQLGAARLIVADLDNNGVPDLIVSGPDASRIWLGEGAPGRFVALKAELPGNLVAAVDLEGKGRLDLVGLDRDGRPIRLVNSGKKDYRWQVIRPVAKVGPDLGDNRINSYGIGGEMEVRSGSFFVKQPIAAPEVHFGLGTRSHVDVLRIEWPNGTPQFEFPTKIDSTFEAEQRLKGSCPFLFTWNGERFVFVADFMWITPLGMFINAQDTGRGPSAEKGTVPFFSRGIERGDSPRRSSGPTTEWIKIRGDQLVPRDGYYEVRVNANLWETHFFDHLSLVAVDHPTDTEMFVNERFSPAAAGPEMQITSPPRPIARARDQDGKDVTELTNAIDGRYLDHFQRGTYQGLAKDHWVEIELPSEPHPSPLTPHRPAGAGTPPTWLLATGWIHPTDSSINFALAQGKHDRPRGLTLEIPDGKGGWKVARDDLGFPAGKNKTMIVRLDGINGLGVPRRFRLRTNMEIYWDALQIAEGRPDSPIEKTELLAETADLRYRGILEMTEANRSSPELPNYDHIVAHGQHWRDLIGYHTRYGYVRELLAGIDDRYVIACGGDEIVLRFKAPARPQPGWKRDFIWVSDGWVKDGDLNTRFGKTVLPLPSHDAKSYDAPPGQVEDDPVYKKHAEDWQNYHTRYVTPDLYERGLRGNRSDTNPKR